MSLLHLLLRWAMLVAGALLGLGLFLLAVLTFTVLVVVSLLRGRRPSAQFRMNRNPWAQRRAPAEPVDDVVDIEVREVREAAPLPLQPPR